MSGPRSLRAHLVRNAVQRRLFGKTEALHLGRYELRDHLGSGAMGSVFLARDAELDRDVALKVLPDEDGVRRRVQREARAMAKLRHPNVVAVYEVGMVEGRAFIAMEYVDGTTLSAWLAEAPRSPEAIIEAFRQAGSGLAAAHRAGVTHRDFKPDNVLVGRDGRVQVTDFGVADAQGSWSSSEAVPLAVTDLTRAGTPRYMAPEQLMGGEASAASDQFAFCVALFEALHGEPPFRGDTLAELAEAARTGRMIAPSTRRELPPSTVAAMQRGLRASPDDRFASMPALLTALAPTTRRPRWPLVSFLLVLLASASGAALWLASENEPPVVAPLVVSSEPENDSSVALAVALAAGAIDDAAAAVARGGALPPEVVACGPASPSCSYYGRCALRDGSCVAIEASACQRAAICKVAGACAASDGACIAASDSHCETSEICKRDGACRAEDGRCRP